MEPGEMALRFHFPFIPSVTSRHVYATNPCHRRKVRGEPSDSSRAASVSIRSKERSPTPAGSAGGVSLHGREADGRRGDESATGVRRKLGGAGVRWPISPFGYRSAWPWPRGREGGRARLRAARDASLRSARHADTMCRILSMLIMLNTRRLLRAFD